MPRVSQVRGVRAIAPSDPDGGGTWIGVNEYGVTVCLLNAYPATPVSDPLSRGKLVQSLLASRSSLQAVALVRRRDLSRFLPFTLVALDAENPARAALWDGRYVLALPDADELCPLTSSSLNHAYANSARRQEWRERKPVNVGMLHEFHRSHGSGPGAWSVCMHRSDAETVSFTQVTVSPRRVEMHYSPDAPCKADLLVTTTLERKPLHDFTTRITRAFHTAG